MANNRRQIEFDWDTLIAYDSIASALQYNGADGRTGVASTSLRAARAVVRNRRWLLQVFPELKGKELPPPVERLLRGK